jgi:cbb3-type cytochrome oxidase subunit 1
MPPLTRWMIKTSFVYLFLALLLNAALPFFSLSGIRTPFQAASFGPISTHVFVVGWVSMLIFGVVFWMFPKFTREQPRGSELLGWATFSLINAGLVLRILAEGLNAPAYGWGWVLVVSALLQWLGGLSFVVNTWPRVKEK